ncbi:hypothetical protein CL621_03910 [archaeon]|nr:hypothetical protein [archaeon]|tara:strand:- start:1331 stop:1966 length:636 start_codon:yes stop_codon:yes gene_type:complete
MLTDKLKENIARVDILSDFDEVMIKGQSAYKEVLTYFWSLPIVDNIKFIERAKEKYFEYIETGDVRAFYELLSGCQVKVLDRVANKLKKNKRWHNLVGNTKVGIVSRNNRRIILKYLKLNSIDAEIIAANEPEILGDIYTGNVDIIVNNDKLVDFVKEKDYICGDEEKEILEGFGIDSIKLDKGIYICSNQKDFKENYYIMQSDGKFKNFE